MNPHFKFSAEWWAYDLLENRNELGDEWLFWLWANEFFYN